MLWFFSINFVTTVKGEGVYGILLLAPQPLAIDLNQAKGQELWISTSYSWYHLKI